MLRNTYPTWDIGHQGDPSGVLWWIAELRQPVTPELVAAGVSRTIRREDAIALAATLGWQTALLHTVRPVLLAPGPPLSGAARRAGGSTREPARRWCIHSTGPAAAPPEVTTMHTWESHTPRGSRLRIHETSCCGEYELASEGGEYFVLRWTKNSAYEETSRGIYGRAAQAWRALAEAHVCSRRTSGSSLAT
ncbi:hypothetical protein E1267_00055 [Nonomuraea longispora]|uniref:Uncharacterized protein n=1 Tax=Nonomuraea longispora TaxID=1848320 RepID=A0A4R4NR39_9ACTN|nr:hypothetical protein [Nonomuraea longispora]TDC11384.1 hypothetical protein E1267_00055 [Nonomuraea longispora]